MFLLAASFALFFAYQMFNNVGCVELKETRKNKNTNAKNFMLTFGKSTKQFQKWSILKGNERKLAYSD